MLNTPSQIKPEQGWEHYEMWERVYELFYSLPNYFETELMIKGVNVTEIYSVGGAFATVIETQVVRILNNLRTIWDPDNKYSKYAFVRQSQTFPDVLFRNQQNDEDIVFGIELKSWYVLSKEGEPSFRYKVTPEVCANADLIVVIPWILSDVISGTPSLLKPYTELARYVAEYRNFYWQQSRINQGDNPTIRTPPTSNLHPYPSSKQEASDEAESDKGGNFGRIARSGILDKYINEIKSQDYLGIKIAHWITFFKAISETSKDSEIEGKLERLRIKIQKDKLLSSRQQVFIEILDKIESLWEMTE